MMDGGGARPYSEGQRSPRLPCRGLILTWRKGTARLRASTGARSCRNCRFLPKRHQPQQGTRSRLVRLARGQKPFLWHPLTLYIYTHTHTYTCVMLTYLIPTVGFSAAAAVYPCLISGTALGTASSIKA